MGVAEPVMAVAVEVAVAVAEAAAVVGARHGEAAAAERLATAAVGGSLRPEVVTA